jgi:hypothetical protein
MEPMTDRALQLDAEVDRFLSDNPHIYRQFRLLAVKLKARGIERYGAKSLWEVLRWQLAVETNANAKDYKLNNNYVSRVARRLMQDEPEEFSGFFELRRLRGGKPD